MDFLTCPDCGSSELTIDFSCQYCQNLLLNGKKADSKPIVKTISAPDSQVSIVTETNAKKTINRTVLFGAVGCVLLICLFGFAYSGLTSGKTKSLKVVNSELFAQNNVNKFAVETNQEKNLTAITLTQENIKLSSENNPPLNIKLLFDCVIEGEILSRTPDEYHITILSNNTDWKNFGSARFEFQTEKELIKIKAQNGDKLTSGDNSLEYISYLISRKELAIIANSTQTAIHIGEYDGQITFAQQQAIKSFLAATSIDSEID